MYGWRARLGLLIPSGNVATEIDIEKIIPNGVSSHCHRFKFAGGKSEAEVVQNLKLAELQIEDAAEMLMDAEPAVIAMTGTGVSFIGGYGYDKMLIEKMRPRCGNIPVTTTTTAATNGLKALKVKKISISMPYVEPVAHTVAKFMEDSGFKVMNYKWLGKGHFDIAHVTSEEIYNLVKSADTPETEAHFVSCTNLHVAEIIKDLEIDLGKPLVTSNQASAWECLRLAGIKDSISGWGTLLENY